MEVVWSDTAIDSLADIVLYIQRFFSRRVASNTIIRIRTFVAGLSHSPRIGRLIHSSELYGELRCAYYKQNHTYYRIVNGQIEVILIWDGRQDPSRVQALLINFLMRD
jgi:plasmid stabilization system protein ParE